MPSHGVAASCFPLCLALLAAALASATAGQIPHAGAGDTLQSWTMTPQVRTQMEARGTEWRKCDRKMIVADAAGGGRTKDEQELADMTAESMMLGPIPILWQFGTQIGRWCVYLCVHVFVCMCVGVC